MKATIECQGPNILQATAILINKEKETNQKGLRRCAEAMPLSLTPANRAQ